MTTKPARFRKRPVAIEAVQWTGDNADALEEFATGVFHQLDEVDRANSDDPDATAEVYDRLHSTWMLAYTDDWIIRGVQGEYYPIRGDVFIATYEPADQPKPTITSDIVEAAAPHIAAQALRNYANREHPGFESIAHHLEPGLVEYDAVCTGCGSVWDSDEGGCTERVELLRAANALITPPACNCHETGAPCNCADDPAAGPGSVSGAHRDEPEKARRCCDQHPDKTHCHPCNGLLCDPVDGMDGIL